MTKMVDNHIIGNIANKRNSVVFDEAGFITSFSTVDYGEDFHVVSRRPHPAWFETFEDEVPWKGGHPVNADNYVEPFRVHVQSKGTTTDKDTWTEPFPVHTLLKWIESNDLVVVIKRHINSNEARFFIPEAACNIDDILDRPRTSSMDIKFERSFARLDDAKTLVWHARLRHYDRQIRLETLGGNSTKRIGNWLSELLSITGVIDLSTGGLTENTQNSMFIRALATLSNAPDGLTEEALVHCMMERAISEVLDWNEETFAPSACFRNALFETLLPHAHEQFRRLAEKEPEEEPEEE